MDEIRAFIAIELSPEMKRILELTAHQLAEQLIPGTVRWVKTENIHLTLRFLGDTPRAKLPQLAGALDRIGVWTAPFDLMLDSLGCFPNPRKPRVIWVGVSDSDKMLKMLQKDVEKMVTALGWKPDHKRFQPHLTLGRVKDSRSVVEARLPWGQKVASRIMPVDSIRLIESRLHSSGAVYTVRHTATLRDRV